MTSSSPTVASAQMLIRKDVKQVFNAFIDPVHTTQFWFTKSSGPLIQDQEVIWTWEMYGFEAKALPIEIIDNEIIKLLWYGPGQPTTVEIVFQSISDDTTFVTITHSDFEIFGAELTAAIVDSTGGFALVVSGLKAYLEHGINLNLIADKYPKEISQH